MSYANYYNALCVIACEAGAQPVAVPPPPEFGDAILALRNAFATLFPTDGALLITRHGLDAALDVLFAHPQIAPLLLWVDPDTFGPPILSSAHPRYADFWTHIVRPAWDQHAAIQRVAASTAATG